MRRDVPKVLVDLPLREYAAEYAEEFLRVWVNPCNRLVRERWEVYALSRRLVKPPPDAPSGEGGVAELKARSNAWLSELLSQGAEAEEHVSPADLEAYFEQSPDFVQWLTGRVATLLDTYRAREKKS
jgi:hypothetical protein